MSEPIAKSYRYCAPITCIFLALMLLLWTLGIQLPDMRMIPVWPGMANGNYDTIMKGVTGIARDGPPASVAAAKINRLDTLQDVKNSVVQNTKSVKDSINTLQDEDNSIVQKNAPMKDGIIILNDERNSDVRFATPETETGHSETVKNVSAVDTTGQFVNVFDHIYSTMVTQHTSISPGSNIENHEAIKDIIRFSQPSHPLTRNITIGLYRPYHGLLKLQKQRLDTKMCPYYNCDVRFFNTTAEVIDTDAVIFQGNHMPTTMPLRNNLNQVYVFLDVEAPQYLHQFNQLHNMFWNGFFNWTMTYRFDSDIPYVYGATLPRGNTYVDVRSDLKDWHRFIENIRNEGYANMSGASENPTGIIGKNYSEIFHRKKSTAAWIVTHCWTKHASNREVYVNAMADYIDLDVYGPCSGLECPKNTQYCTDLILDNHHFYLAFENSICNEYITEKVYWWFASDIVLVVRGARLYPKLLPVGTYIDSDDFKSPRHLAEFLTELRLDETRYVNYLKRKDEYRVVNHQTMVQMAYCELCKRLNHVKEYRKTVNDIHIWWRQNQCLKAKDIRGSTETTKSAGHGGVFGSHSKKKRGQ